MRNRRVTIPLLSLLLLLAPALHAGETGSVSGVVKDTQGLAVPGATVKISGPLLPAGLEKVTGSNGDFQFQRLLPGTYKVEASLAAMGTVAREIRVLVDVDAQLSLVLSPTVTETVTVVAEAPVADLKNTEVNFNYTADEIGKLPLQRSYEGLFQLIPGVPDNNSTLAGLVSGGGSRQDNTYLVDGVNISNPAFGYLSNTEINELDIVEFNVKRGAISAEFGRSSGLVTNAVTRSGTNGFSGTLRFEAIPDAFIAQSKDPALQEKRDRWIPALGLGGPVVKDKFWWYASGRLYRSTLSERRNNTGAIPDRTEDINEWQVKLTARPSPKHFLSGSFRNRPSTTDNASISVNDFAEMATNDETKSRLATAVWSFFPTDRTVVDVKYLHLDEDNESVALTDLGARGTFDVRNPQRMGEFTDPTTGFHRGGNDVKFAAQNFARDEVRVSFTQFLDWGTTSHQVKAGVSWETTEEDLTRIPNAWGFVDLVQNRTQFATNYYPDQPAQISKSRTYGIFVQDAITIGSRVTVNAGLLLNRDEFIQDLAGSGGCPATAVGSGVAVYGSDGDRCTFLRFNFFDQVQPRIGLNVNVREGKADKIYANYGRYYSLDQKSSSRSLAPNRLFTQDTVFNATTGAIISNAPRASTTGKVLDGGMKATYVDEFLGGYATPIGGNWGLDVFFTFRDLTNVIEDQPRVLPASSFWVSNVPAGERRYRALVVELNRRLADRWALNLSYSWSKLYGNFDVDYATAGNSGFTGDSVIFNTSSILQDGPGVNVEEPERQGVLTQDRPHVFKLFANWAPVEKLLLGGYLRVQSGIPFAQKGRDWYNGYRRYLEPAGSSRNDTWTNFDFLGSYQFSLGKRAGLTLEARVLNVLNTQTALARDDRPYLDGRIRLTAPPWLVQGTTQPNPQFKQPVVYAPPRRLVLTALLTF